MGVPEDDVQHIHPEHRAVLLQEVRDFLPWSTTGLFCSHHAESVFLDVCSSFVTKQAIFLVCHSMHNAYLFQPLIRAGSNPSKENIKVFTTVFVGIKVVTPPLKS